GRRLIDDVVDIAARAVAGALCGTPVNQAPAGTSPTNSTCTSGGNNNGGGANFVGTQVLAIGDGVNVNDVALQSSFPYVAYAQSGYVRQHHNPGDKACGQALTSNCPTQ